MAFLSPTRQSKRAFGKANTLLLRMEPDQQDFHRKILFTKVIFQAKQLTGQNMQENLIPPYHSLILQARSSTGHHYFSPGAGLPVKGSSGFIFLPGTRPLPSNTPQTSSTNVAPHKLGLLLRTAAFLADGFSASSDSARGEKLSSVSDATPFMGRPAWDGVPASFGGELQNPCCMSIGRVLPL